MHVVSWETNKTRFSKNTSPQIGENQNCPTWVRSPLQIAGRYSIYKQLVCTSIWNCDSPSCSSVSDRQKRKSKVIAKNATRDIEESDGSFFILLFGFLCEHMPKIAVACLNAVHKVEQVGQLASTFPVFRYFVGRPTGVSPEGVSCEGE